MHLFSLLAISKILSNTTLKVFDTEIIHNHGGSIRFYVCKKNSKFRDTKNLKLLKFKEIK